MDKVETALVSLTDQYCGARGLVDFSSDGRCVIVRVRPEFKTEIPQIYMGVRVKIIPWEPPDDPGEGTPMRAAA
jgi:hypothetical protein